MIGNDHHRWRTLECDRSWCQCHKTTETGRGLTHCPCHGPDRNPSLSVTTLLNGTVLIHCFAGCNQLTLWESLFGKPVRDSLGLPPRTRHGNIRAKSTELPV